MKTLIYIILITTTPFGFNSIAAQCNATANFVQLDCYGTCAGTGTVNPTGQSPFIYLWSNGQTTQTATGLCYNSSYTVTVTDANLCSTTAVCAPFSGINQVIITVTTPASCQTCCDGVIDAGTSTVSGCGPYVKEWDGNTAFSYTLNNVCPGYHTFCIIDACGCIVCDSIMVPYPVSAGGLSNENIFPFLIFPNPSTGVFNLSWNVEEDCHFEIVNSIGDCVFSGTGPVKEIDLSGCPSGIYLVSITLHNGSVFSKRLIVE